MCFFAAPMASAPAGGAASSPTPLPYPPLVVFDLDFTLWPLDVDTHVTAPFSTDPATSRVRDATGTACPLYPDVRAALAQLAAGGSQIAYASRTTDPAAAEALLKAHGLWALLGGDRELFQAYPSGGGGAAKTRHFARIHAATGLAAGDTLFFDDMRDNVAKAREAGITAVLLDDGRGLSAAAFEQGLQQWRAARR